MHLMPAETTSYWLKTAETTEHPVLRQSLEPDVLIVGGGITGITCAYELAKRGHKPVVIEAGEIGCETTGKTTGKLTIQHGLIYSALADKYGLDYAGMYVRSQTEALDFAKNIAAESSIPCQMAPSNAYLYASAQEDLKALEKERAVAAGLGVQCTLLHNKSSFPESFGMLMFAGQAVFHPVRYVRGLARQAVALGAEIFCRTKAVVVNNDHEPSVTCENGVTIKPRHLVLATQSPIYSGPNLFFTRLYAKRSYAIAVKAERDWPEGSYINVSGRTRSFRTHWENGERILIVAGEDHPTGRSEIDMDRRFMNLVSFAEKHAGVREVLAKWSAQDYDTPDQIPYIDRISGSSTIYVATGFKKWGLTSGTLAGLLIPELIETGACRYEALYSRKRSDYTSSLSKTISEVGQSLLELIRSKLEKPESLRDLKRGEGRVIRFNGTKAGIYRDEQDRVVILDLSCAHMSTELHYNSAEKTWDCPAHGGRFSADGTLLEGPPKHSLTVYYRGNFSDLSEAPRNPLV